MSEHDRHAQGNLQDKTTLGRTGLRVSRLGIGCSYGVPSDAIEKAFHEHGVNYLYWGALRRGNMKKAIRNLGPAQRDRLVIALQTFDRTGPLMRTFYQKGLKALGIEYADVLILGWRNKLPSERLLNSALRLKEAGEVRFLAVSGHRRRLFAELLQRDEKSIDLFMVRYNAAHRGAETEVFPHLPRENRPGVMCYTATRLRDLLKQRKMPPGERPLTAAECYRFVLSNPSVDLCITGPATREHMDEALSVLEAGPLSQEELERARRLGDYVHAKMRWRPGWDA